MATPVSSVAATLPGSRVSSHLTTPHHGGHRHRHLGGWARGRPGATADANGVGGAKVVVAGAEASHG